MKKLIAFGLIVAMMFSFVGVDVAMASYGAKTFYYSDLNSSSYSGGSSGSSDGEGPLEIVAGLVMLGAIIYGISRIRGWKQERIDNYFENNPDRVRFREFVENGNVILGMNRTEVNFAWGSPKRRNTSSTALGYSEQWVYSYKYVYLMNGIVTGTQHSGL